MFCHPAHRQFLQSPRFVKAAKPSGANQEAIDKHQKVMEPAKTCVWGFEKQKSSIRLEVKMA